MHIFSVMYVYFINFVLTALWSIAIWFSIAFFCRCFCKSWYFWYNILNSVSNQRQSLSSLWQRSELCWSFISASCALISAILRETLRCWSELCRHSSDLCKSLFCLYSASTTKRGRNGEERGCVCVCVVIINVLQLHFSDHINLALLTLLEFVWSHVWKTKDLGQSYIVLH